MKVVSSIPCLAKHFSIFFYQNETKSEEICDHESLCPREIVKLVLLDFSILNISGNMTANTHLQLCGKLQWDEIFCEVAFLFLCNLYVLKVS